MVRGPEVLWWEVDEVDLMLAHSVCGGLLVSDEVMYWGVFAV